MLTFVTPLLLAGGLLIAVPILLHLVMRQQPKHLEFPALRFIQQRKESNRRRLLLRHIVLMALRCLAILLLALTLARPKISSSSFLPGGDEPLAAALVFDTSPRMEYRHENATRLEQAQQFAFELLPQLPRDSELVVLDSTARRSDFDVDAGAARLRVERLNATTNNRPMDEMLDNAVQLVESSDLARKEVFLFTDLAESQWSGEMRNAWASRAASFPNIAFHVIDVGVEEPVNFALDDIRLSDQIISRNGTLGIETSIRNVGNGGDRTVKMYLLDEQGRPQLEGETLVKLEPGQSDFIEFRLGGLEIGAHHGYVQIEGEDGLSADDRRYFSFEVAAPWRILLASPEPVDYYGGIIQLALAPPELRQKGIARFDCELVSQSKLSDMPLEVYDAIWLIDPKPLSQQAWQRLAGYVATGGGVAVLLGGNAGKLGQIDDSFNNSSAAELLPGPITLQWRLQGDDVYLAPRSLEHPVLAPFKSLEGDIPWVDFPIFKYWEFGKLADDVNTITPFSNGDPALLERPVGRGRVLSFATPLTDLPSDRNPWNYLLTGPNAWPGLILATEMANYLVDSVDRRLNFTVGQQVELDLPTGETFDYLWLVTPPPASDRIKTTPLGPENRLVVTATDSPGTYRLEAGGEQGVSLGFSVNLPADETQLARIDEEALQQITEPENVDLARKTAAIDEMLKGLGTGTAPIELFPWLLVLTVLIITTEQLVSSLFYRQVDTGQAKARFKKMTNR